jgi:hypothetical protein
MALLVLQGRLRQAQHEAAHFDRLLSLDGRTERTHQLNCRNRSALLRHYTSRQRLDGRLAHATGDPEQLQKRFYGRRAECGTIRLQE